MLKMYIVIAVVLVSGGLFLYMQPVSAPTVDREQNENPFGEGSEIVGSFVESTAQATKPVSEKKSGDVIEKRIPPGAGTAGSSGTAETADPPSSTVPNTEPDSPTPSVPAQEAPKVVTRAELAVHNTQASCWVAYKGIIYDLTAWLPKHPGSAGAIAPFCGKAEEFASAFTGKHGTGKEARLQKEGVVEGSLVQ